MKSVTSFSVFRETTFGGGSVADDEAMFLEGPFRIQYYEAEPQQIVHNDCRVEARDRLYDVVIETRLIFTLLWDMG